MLPFYLPAITKFLTGPIWQQVSNDTSEKEIERLLEKKDKVAKLEPGEYFGIPYSILVPKGWTNLWVAGRCSSSDVMVHGSIRV
ncbi:MAG: FAD-dependent oxidoreductase, partial [Bacteroidales bacterium]|nr:FAD-dependent oxidoreductase [Bacteroidales bacterium]